MGTPGTRLSLGWLARYETFTGLVIAYVPEAAAVAGEQALSTPSWHMDGYYAEGPTTKKRAALLEAYTNRWAWLRNTCSRAWCARPSPPRCNTPGPVSLPRPASRAMPAGNGALFHS